MTGLDLIRRLPAKLVVAMFQYVFPVFVLARSLLGSLIGIALLSSILYCVMWRFGDTRPFTPAQLALWLDDLPGEAKTSFVTVVLTVLGFLVAFHTATANWKTETQARMRMEIADQIEEFFSEVFRLSDKATIFGDRLLNAVESVKKHGRSPERDSQVSYEYSKATEFLATRDRLMELAVQVHRIGSRHGTTLLSVWGAPAALEDCVDSLSAMSDAIWIKVPFIIEHHPDPVVEIIRQLDATEYKSFLACFEQNHAQMAALSGALRGALLQPLAQINFAWVAGMRRPKLMKAMAPALERVRKKRR